LRRISPPVKIGAMMRFLPLLLALLFLALGIGIVHWRPAEEIAPSPPPGWSRIRPPRDVMALCLAGPDVYAGGEDGVWRIHRSREQATRLDGPWSRVRDLLRDRAGAIWIAHGAGVSRLSPEPREFGIEDGLPFAGALCLFEDRNGRLWAGTEAGAAVRDGERWRKEGLPLANPVVNRIAQDREGGFWFGSYDAPRGGVTRIAPDGSVRSWTPADGLPHANVTAFCEDAEGTMWVGTGLFDRGGLAAFRREGPNWRLSAVLGKEHGLAGPKVRSLLSDRLGRLWVGSEQEGLAVREGARWRLLTVDNGLSSGEVKSIVEDEAGSIWLGTRDGVTRLPARP